MLWMKLDRQAGISLARQVFEQIRQSILCGDLKRAEKLPSTRELAAQLNVSRNVVVEAYEQLLAEGYIESLRGSGTYVAEGACLAARGKGGGMEVNQNGSGQPWTGGDIDFRSGLPALDCFPVKKWGMLFREICGKVPVSALGYGDSAGSAELRGVIADYLLQARGVCCKPEQVIITTGAVQALALAARLMLPGRADAVVEDPLNYDLQEIFTAAGAVLYPVPVDAQGIRTELLPGDISPRFMYVTPSHQFPLGGILPIRRRIELVNYAERKDGYILEDDYDSEFRYEGMPVSSLQGLCPERVVYVGTFSKTLFPALRIGYLIVPAPFVSRCIALKRHADFQTPMLEQLVLARFIREGFFQRHILKMRKVYRKRREKLIKSLGESFGEGVAVYGEAAGLHLVAGFMGMTFTEEALGKLKAKGVRVHALREHCMDKALHGDKLILGYGSLTEAQLEEGVKRLKQGILAYMEGTR